MPPGFDFDDPRPPQRSIGPDWQRDARLWLVLDEAAASPRSLAETTRQAIHGGIDAILCRLKTQPAAEVYRLAREVREICAEAACPFVMSHHAALAIHLEAEGLQLGAGDISLASARQMLGQGAKLGRSCHSLAEAGQAFSEGADYVFLGPVYNTPSKAAYGPPLGLGLVAQAQQLPGPVVYIGGISADNLDPLLAVGARRVAAIRALQSVDEVASACWWMKKQIEQARRD